MLLSVFNVSSLEIFGHFRQNVSVWAHYVGSIFTIFLNFMYEVACGLVDIMYKFQLD